MAVADLHAQQPSEARAAFFRPDRQWKHAAFVAFVILEAFTAFALLFSYGLFQSTRPDAVFWSPEFFSTRSGMIQIGLLVGAAGGAVILSWVVKRHFWMGTLCIMPLLIASGATFAALKVQEQQNQIQNLWTLHKSYTPDKKQLMYLQRAAEKRKAARNHGAPALVPIAQLGPDAVRGKEFFQSTCTACHGADAGGLPRLGVNLRSSEFISVTSDDLLLDFLRKGRDPSDPSNTTGIGMPARGGNPTLTDDKLKDIVAYMREIQAEEGIQAPAAAAPPLTRAEIRKLVRPMVPNAYYFMNMVLWVSGLLLAHVIGATLFTAGVAVANVRSGASPGLRILTERLSYYWIFLGLAGVYLTMFLYG